MTVTRGADVNVTCTAEGHPRPLIAWQHKGHTVASGLDPKFHVTVDGNSSKLAIFNVTMQETGMVTCYVMNYLSFVQASIELWLTPDESPGSEMVAMFLFLYKTVSRKNVYVLSSKFEFKSVSNSEARASS